jgi:pyruvate dehydrogenase E2 component (dihydrolipoamide acetyltransferase)
MHVPGGRVVASPYARKLAREAGVDIAQATGTGPNGRIVAADVQKLISSGDGKTTEAPASAGAPTEVCPKQRS